MLASTIALAAPASALTIALLPGQHYFLTRTVGVQSYTSTTAVAVFGIDSTNTQPETFGCASNLLYIDLSQPVGRPALDVVMRGWLTRVDFTKDANNVCWVYLVQG